MVQEGDHELHYPGPRGFPLVHTSYVCAPPDAAGELRSTGSRPQPLFSVASLSVRPIPMGHTGVYASAVVRRGLDPQTAFACDGFGAGQVRLYLSRLGRLGRKSCCSSRFRDMVRFPRNV